MTDLKHTTDANQRSDNDEELTQLYHKEKGNQASPSSIRRNVILAAKKEELASNSLANKLKRWTNTSKSLVAASAVIALVAVVWLGQYKIEQGGFNQAQYTNVQIHSFSGPQELASNKIRLQYDAAYKEFLQQQGTLSAHHQSSARLKVSEDGWSLATCQNELLEISDELLAVLNDMQLIDNGLSTGDSVEILFARDGRILQIIKAQEPLRC